MARTAADRAGTAGAAAMPAPGLIGRDRELALLREAVEGPPTTILIEGEAGIGKSRLVREFLAALDAGRVVLRAQCPPFREPYTLGPIVDAVRQLAGDATAARLSALGGALRPLFPEWSAHLPPAVESAGDARAARYQVFRALAELLGLLDVAVLVLEDAHWADEATLEFALFIVEARQGQPSLAVTYRPEDLPATSLLRRLSSRSAGASLPVRLSLAPLTVHGVGQLVSSMLSGTSVSGEFAAFMHRHTDGLPLAAEETIRLLHDRADLIWRDGGWARRHLTDVAVPPTYRDAVLERMSRLSEGTQLVLRAAAVLAEPASQELIGWVADLPGDQARDGLLAAVSSGLLDEDRPGLLSFRHMLAGRAVYEAIPAPSRGELHLRAGGPLARRDPQPVAQLARHYRAAGDADNWCFFAEQAADVALAAGDEASACLLLYDLITQARLPARSVARLTGKIPFASFTGDARHSGLVRALHDSLAGVVADPRGEAEVRLQLGRVLHFMEDDAQAMRQLALAVPKLAGDPLLAAGYLGMLGWPEGTDWAVATHRRWLRRGAAALAAMDAARVHVTPDERLRILGDQMCVLLQLGDPEGWVKAARLPEEAAAPAEAVRLVTIQYNIGLAAIMWGRHAEAERRLRLALRLARRHQYEKTRGLILVAQARLDWFAGSWDGLAERAALLATDPDIPPGTRREADLVAGFMDVAAGLRGKAAQRLELAYANTRGHATSYAIEAAAALARLRLADGDADAALQLTEGPVAILGRKGLWLWGTDILPVHADALTSAGRRDEAAELVRVFEAGLRGQAAATSMATLASCRAILAERDGGARPAALFARAAAAWQSMPRPYDALLARERQARCLLAAGRAEAGLGLLAGTAAALTELGAAFDSERVSGSLREHRMSRRTGRRGYGDELSPRELEVVKLVLTGRTNREIAAELCRSPKTVATQLYSAMRKLNVTSRTALAVRALEAGVPAENGTAS